MLETILETPAGGPEPVELLAHNAPALGVAKGVHPAKILHTPYPCRVSHANYKYNVFFGEPGQATPSEDLRSR